MPPETDEIERLVDNPPIPVVEEEKPKGSRHKKDYLVPFAQR